MERLNLKKAKIVVLYSGGTDSTCAAAKMAEEFKEVQLLTFFRKGFCSVENAGRNVKYLENKFPETEIIHKFLDVEPLARYVSTHHYWKNIYRYGFFSLSNCIACVLINHFATLLYCGENLITQVADGITREWPFFPSHMEKVVGIFKKMYKSFNITYHTPVYDFELPAPFQFMHKLDGFKKNETVDKHKNTTGNYLYERGIFPERDLKGSKEDHLMQPKCNQFVLHHIYLYWYFMNVADYQKYETLAVKFIEEKIADLFHLLDTKPHKLKKLMPALK